MWGGRADVSEGRRGEGERACASSSMEGILIVTGGRFHFNDGRSKNAR